MGIKKFGTIVCSTILKLKNHQSALVEVCNCNYTHRWSHQSHHISDYCYAGGSCFLGLHKVISALLNMAPCQILEDVVSRARNK